MFIVPHSDRLFMPIANALIPIPNVSKSFSPAKKSQIPPTRSNEPCNSDNFVAAETRLPTVVESIAPHSESFFIPSANGIILLPNAPKSSLPLNKSPIPPIDSIES